MNNTSILRSGMVSDVNIVQRHALVTFFVLAYAISWIGWTLLFTVFGAHAIFPTQVGLTLIGGLGPLMAAMAVSYWTKGRSRLGDYLRHLVRWRTKARWILLAFVLPGFVIPAIAMAIQFVADGTVPSIAPLSTFLPSYLLTLFLVGGFHEDLAWSGFALPRLQKTHSALGSALILGVLWGAWHLPLFFLPGTIQSSFELPVAMIFLAPIVQFVPVMILQTWIFNSAGGIVLPVILWHHTLNATLNTWLPQETQMLYIFVQWLLAIVVIVLFKPKHLSARKRTTVD